MQDFDEEDVFEEVDERDFQQLVQERINDDFVVDDGGRANPLSSCPFTRTALVCARGTGVR